MKKNVMCLMLLAGIVMPLFAEQRVNISRELSMELPDDMEIIKQTESSCIFSAASEKCIVSLYAIEKKSGGWNPKVIDRTLFPGLAIENMTKSKEDWFLQLGKDYIKRYYEQDGRKIVTFSSHTYSWIYVFLFETVDNTALDKFDGMLKSIKYERNFVENALHVYNCAKTIWFILFLIVSLFSILIFEMTKGEDKGAKWAMILFVTFAEGVLLLLPLWGNMNAVLAAMLVFFVVNIIGGLWGIYFKSDD